MSVCQLAQERNCKLYVDAEQTYMQAAIESFGQQMTHSFNRGDSNIILNGYQCYLKRMSAVIEQEVACAKILGYNLGIKLIRGAYMEEERTLAKEHGYESPIWDSIEDTHKCYNENLEHIIKNLESTDLLMLGSHNIDSVKMATDLLIENGVKDDRVRFAQLRGFSDQITGQLALKNFRVYKYLPYGPTDQVMPYLVRRGQESKQVLREQEFQNTFLRQEILKRLSFWTRQ